jgi:hypothetical protein
LTDESGRHPRLWSHLQRPHQRVHLKGNFMIVIIVGSGGNGKAAGKVLRAAQIGRLL